MAHIKKLLQFCSTPEIYFLPIWWKIGIVLIDLEKYNNSNYPTPFLLQSDFLENQVPMLIYKDFWYQELTDKMQLYYRTYIFIVQDGIHVDVCRWVHCCHCLLLDNLREERSVPLTRQVAHVLEPLAAHQCALAHRRKITDTVDCRLS